MTASLRLFGLRGATTCSANTSEAIRSSVRDLMDALVDRNGLSPDRIVSVTFSVTADLDACFPAAEADSAMGGMVLPCWIVSRWLSRAICPVASVSWPMPGFRRAQHRSIPIWRAPASCVQTDLVTTDSLNSGPERPLPHREFGKLHVPIVISMDFKAVLRSIVGATAATAVGLGGAFFQAQAVRAQGGTPGLLEFRWDNDRDYQKLYYYQTSTLENDRSEWFLLLRSKDRKTAFMKLTVTQCRITSTPSCAPTESRCAAPKPAA